LYTAADYARARRRSIQRLLGILLLVVFLAGITMAGVQVGSKIRKNRPPASDHVHEHQLQRRDCGEALPPFLQLNKPLSIYNLSKEILWPSGLIETISPSAYIIAQLDRIFRESQNRLWTLHLHIDRVSVPDFEKFRFENHI
jgi:hypothetical protein